MKDQTDSNEDKKILGLERNIFFSGLTSFLTDTSTKMVYCIMPLFLLSKGIRTAPRGSLIAGILYDRVNYSAPFYFGASTALLAAIMMFVFYRRKSGKQV